MTETENQHSNREIILSAGKFRARVSPWGASLRGLWREDVDGTTQDVVTGYSGAKNKTGGQGDVLIPFPGRVQGGKYSFEGEAHQMQVGDKDGPNAIHGFLRQTSWQVTEHNENAVTFSVSLAPDAAPGYPFGLQSVVTYALDADTGLTCRFAVENVGKTTAPVAAGFHPYFTVGSDSINDDVLTLPFAATLEFEKLLPTGRVLPVDGTPMDFRVARSVGETVFNTCYLHPQRDSDGLLRVQLAGKSNTVIVWMDQAFDYVVLYSGDPLPPTHARRALAIEPMTCGSDAFNHPEWGLVSLASGETLRGAWGVNLAPASTGKAGAKG